jgi:hypothetical protein
VRAQGNDVPLAVPRLATAFAAVHFFSSSKRRRTMEKWIIMVENHITDPSREKEVDAWYEKIHMPDLLQTPGYLSAKRYVAKEPRNGRGKYLAVYEVETDNIDKTLAVRQEYIAKEKAAGRTSGQMFPGLFLPEWQWVTYKEILSQTKGGTKNKS